MTRQRFLRNGTKPTVRFETSLDKFGIVDHGIDVVVALCPVDGFHLDGALGSVEHDHASDDEQDQEKHHAWCNPSREVTEHSIRFFSEGFGVGRIHQHHVDRNE